MNFKSTLAAAALAVMATGALAADQNLTLSATGSNANGTNYSGSFAAIAAPGGSLVGSPLTFVADALLSGGSDTITFAGAAAGLYNVVFNGSGSFLTGLSGTLNGQALTITNLGPTFTFFTTVATLSPSFVLTLNGSAAANALMSGNITVTAVPEPETYALLLAGLGAVGFMARRRRPQA